MGEGTVCNVVLAGTLIRAFSSALLAGCCGGPRVRAVPSMHCRRANAICWCSYLHSSRYVVLRLRSLRIRVCLCCCMLHVARVSLHLYGLEYGWCSEAPSLHVTFSGPLPRAVLKGFRSIIVAMCIQGPRARAVPKALLTARTACACGRGDPRPSFRVQTL